MESEVRIKATINDIIVHEINKNSCIMYTVLGVELICTRSFLNVFLILSYL